MREVPAAEPTVVAGLATIVFMRPSYGMGQGTGETFIIDENQHAVAQLAGNTVVFVHVAPGTHTFVSLMGNTADAIRATVVAGRIYRVIVYRFQDYRWFPRFVVEHPRAGDTSWADLSRYRHIEPDADALAQQWQFELQSGAQRYLRGGIERLARWTGRDLADHILGPGDGVVGNVAAGPTSQPSVPAAQSTPATIPATGCPPGQSVGPDTAGHCCWPAQAWAPSRAVCVGVAACPSGFVTSAEGCSPVGCPDGQSITADTGGHCCWPGQAWAASRNVCVGTPICAPPLRVVRESCLQ